MHLANSDLPVYIDEPGIWVSRDRPFLAGSPDGVPQARSSPGARACASIYEAYAVAPDGGYLCRRSLIEIKTPYKLRKREMDGDFYPQAKLPCGRRVRIPLSWTGRGTRGRVPTPLGPDPGEHSRGSLSGTDPRTPGLMGLGSCYFIVLAPTGYHVQVEPYDAAYVNTCLIPALEQFCVGMSSPQNMAHDGTRTSSPPSRSGTRSASRIPGQPPPSPFPSRGG